jgi:hypothetical protein
MYSRPTSGIGVFSHSENQISFSSQNRHTKVSKDSAT